MLLSITVHGRNDGFHHNFVWRLETVLNKLGLNIASLPAEDAAQCEIIFCDWGSPVNAKLIDTLNLNEQCQLRLRHFYVHPRELMVIERDSTYSSSHAVNTLMRRVRGRHTLSLDSDVYCPEATIHKLYEAAKANSLHGHDLSQEFFWSARRHIPKAYNMQCPSIPDLDAYIAANWQSFPMDKPNKHDFKGATCAMFATRDMWHSCRGLNEALNGWGWNEIDMTHRLRMRYRWGGDIDDFGLIIYHLEHYYTRNMAAENPRKMNPQVYPTDFVVNGENWGLGHLEL